MNQSRLLLVAPAVAGALALAACGSQSSASPAAAQPSASGSDCQVSAGTASATTATYLMVASAGPTEAMFSESEALSHRGKGGEVMLGGSMTDATGPSARHLEIHICGRSSGAVMPGIQPVITVADLTDHSAPRSLSVAAMQGVDSGPGDLHYGNNLIMPAGHSFAVMVTVSGETATMTVASPS